MEGKDNTQYALDIIAGKAERTERRLHVEIRILIVAIVLIVAGFLLYLNQYDFTGTTTNTELSQDGEGLNIINRSGAYIYGTEDENNR